ncbi:hypothetical protein F66182_8514 [Fusarium sp. NRRL 66182]|nr:hypothetical protein F66182_8514 [Fusarium sp. NRRL 66182]
MESPECFAIQDVPGKGKGLVATKTILRGDRILAEAPAIIVQDFLDGSATADEVTNKVLRKVDSLTPDETAMYFSLANAKPEHGAWGIFTTNALPYGPGELDCCIFKNSSRLLHSCAKNAHHHWNVALQKLTVHAIEDIPVGQEITINYCDVRQSRIERQFELFDKFRFECTCRLCSLTEQRLDESDERLELAFKFHLLSVNDTEKHTVSFLRSLHAARAYMDLLRQEGLFDVFSMSIYSNALSITRRNMDDVKRSMFFADASFHNRKFLLGEDSLETEKAKDDLEALAQEGGWGSSLQWRMSDAYQAEHAERDFQSFEDWLFKMEKKTGEAEGTTSLDDDRTFPAFNHMAIDKEASPDFFQRGKPCRDWCVFGEIMFIGKNTLILQDKDGSHMPVTPIPGDVHWRSIEGLRVGGTAAMLYASLEPASDKIRFKRVLDVSYTISVQDLKHIEACISCNKRRHDGF